MIQVAIFSSGSGSNAKALMKHFEAHPTIRVKLLVFNRKEAGVKQKAEAFGLETQYFPKSVFESNPAEIVNFLKSTNIDFILLAGFLLLIPAELVEAFPEKILNIHPALLPDFGGKGMHGMHVHKAVKESGAKKTGMSIHLVDLEYDKGKILFQSSCPVWESDSESDIAARVLKLEHAHYALIAEQYIKSKTEK